MRIISGGCISGLCFLPSSYINTLVIEPCYLFYWTSIILSLSLSILAQNIVHIWNRNGGKYKDFRAMFIARFCDLCFFCQCPFEVTWYDHTMWKHFHLGSLLFDMFFFDHQVESGSNLWEVVHHIYIHRSCQCVMLMHNFS